MRSRRSAGVGVVGLTLLLAGALTAIGAGRAAAQREVPFLSGRVVDEAGLFGSDTARIEQRLRELEQRGAAQMAVLTVDTLAGEPIEDFSIRVAETWQLGDREADDGLLFVVSRSDRKMRLEVGYGLEDRITDVRSRRILDRIVTPAFRNGGFASGTLQAIDAIDTLLEGRQVALLDRDEDSDSGGGIGCGLLFMLVWFGVVIWSRVRHGSGSIVWTSSGGWSGGSSSGGGFSGGGGSFGGGGASGSW